ncbi:MAG: tetratricopeptide repeat protein [Bacteroidia bacterium]
MRKNILILSILFIVFSCNNNQSKITDYKALYDKSMAVKDYHTAITALQVLLLTDSNNTSYLDTLPELYAAVKNFEASNYYTDLALKRYPDSEKYLQIKALCVQQTGNFEEELGLYEKLYESTKKLPYLYQLTAYYFSSGQTKEAKNYLEKLEELSKNSTDSVDFMISETEKQKVPIKAAIYNMKAYMSVQNRDLASAKKFFEMALKEFPDFITAKQNYYQLMQSAR